MLSLYIRNSLITYANHKLRAFNNFYDINVQYDGASMLFVILNSLLPDTRDGLSDIKTKMEDMNMSNFMQDTPKANIKIA